MEWIVIYAATQVYSLPIDSLEVEMQTDSDDSVLFGTTGGAAGYSEVRCWVRVCSSATEEELMKVVDEGDKHSLYLDTFPRDVRCLRQVEIIQNQE